MRNWRVSSKKGLWIGILGASIVAAGTAALYAYGSQETIPPRITYGGWIVGGMTYTAFEAALAEREKRMADRTVLLAAASRERLPARELKLGALGWRVNAGTALERLAVLRRGNGFERAWKRWHARDMELPLTVALDPRALQGSTDSAWPELLAEQTVDARREVTPYDEVRIMPGISARRIDRARLGDALVARLPEVWAASGKPVSPRPIELELPLRLEAPKVTEELLRAQGVERRIASFTTAYLTSSDGRVHNIEKTAAVIHDLLLAPGEVFDYGKMVRETEKRFGYRASTVIIDGQFAPGVGGGICQVSTTLYGAILRAGLEIVERRNHTLPISYVPMGQDATFSSGWINFRFRNNSGSHLLIRTHTDNDHITVKLFGKLDPSVHYTIESKVVETIPPPVKYAKNPTLPQGAVRLIKAGKPGYIVETYRYKRVNGKLESKELISRDKYPAQPSLYASNLGPNSTDAPLPDALNEPLVEDGVFGPDFPSAKDFHPISARLGLPPQGGER